MTNSRPTPNYDLQVADLVSELERLEQLEEPVEVSPHTNSPSYRMKMGRETIWLNTVEFRILRFLAATPYKAYSRRQIAEAVSTSRHPVDVETLDQHIASLREGLGFFRDYIQAVPYIGFRFKA
jgi:DNA-binding response OmpR family regulator